MWLVRRRSPTQPTEIPRQSHRSGIIERSFALSWSPLTTYPDPDPLQRLVLRPDRRFAPSSWPGPPRRWVVERTFSSFGRNRRLAKDLENLAKPSPPSSPSLLSSSPSGGLHGRGP